MTNVSVEPMKLSSPDARTTRLDEADLRLGFLRELSRAVQQEAQLLPRLLPWLRARWQGSAVVWLPSDGATPSVSCDKSYGRERLTADFAMVSQFAAKTQETATPVAGPLPNSNALLVSASATLHGTCFGSIHLIAPANVPETSSALGVMLQTAATLIAAWIARQQWEQEHSAANQEKSRTTTQSLEHVAPDWEQPERSYQRLADAIRPLVGATSLALAVCPLGRPFARIRAVSGVTDFDRNAEAVRALEAVLCELSPSTETTVLFTRHDPQLSVPQRKVLELQQAEQCLIHLLRQGKELVGAWLILRDWDDPTAEQPVDPCLMGQTSAWIDMFRHGEPHYLTQLRQTLIRSVRQPMILIAACLGLLILAVPVRYRINVPCVVEPVTRRFVTVPYEGRLERALVQPGDLVEVNQIVARMDGHEIEIQLSAVMAELQRAKKQRDSNLATHDTSMAQISALEVERLELQCELLAERIRHLEIRSPVAGVVISGDPRKTEGARFNMGQTILEIGPLDSMVLELEVPTDEISHVRLGNEVSFRLESLPYERFTGQVDEVHPRAETRENHHIFLAEMKLSMGQAGFLPGMRGWARMDGDRRAFGWVMFHKFYEQSLFWLGW